MKEGTEPANPINPNIKAEPVKRYTSQLMAMRCIHVPIKETP